MLLVFAGTGFFREFVFLNWNEQMRVTYYSSPDSHVAGMMQWLGSFSYEALYWMKWPLTLIFSALFAFYSYLIVKLLFADRRYNRITLVAYVAVFVASFLFFAIGWMFDSSDVTYDFARFLAGLIETPAMLAILVASFLLHRRV